MKYLLDTSVFLWTLSIRGLRRKLGVEQNDAPKTEWNSSVVVEPMEFS